MSDSTVDRTVRCPTWERASTDTIVGKINDNDIYYLSLDAEK